MYCFYVLCIVSITRTVIKILTSKNNVSDDINKFNTTRLGMMGQFKLVHASFILVSPDKTEISLQSHFLLWISDSLT